MGSMTAIKKKSIWEHLNLPYVSLLGLTKTLLTLPKLPFPKTFIKL
jgi:hypothetical protein